MELNKLKEVIAEIEKRKTFEAIMNPSKQDEKNHMIKDAEICLTQYIGGYHFRLFDLDKEELDYLNERNKVKLCDLQNSLSCL